MQKGCVNITHNSLRCQKNFDKRLVNNFLVVTYEWRKREVSWSNFTEGKDTITSLYSGKDSHF